VTESTPSVAMATANGEVESGARSQAEAARVHVKSVLWRRVEVTLENYVFVDDT